MYNNNAGFDLSAHAPISQAEENNTDLLCAAI